MNRVMPKETDHWLSAEVASAQAFEPGTSREPFPVSASSTTVPTLIEENPLFTLPFNVRESVLFDAYEAGYSSPLQDHFETLLDTGQSSLILQVLAQRLYDYAIRKDKHQLQYNVLVGLSQLPYQVLYGWGSIIAVAATRSKYLDVEELGIRCFENWESRDACAFLSNCRFSESWLQDYANEVCEDVMENALGGDGYGRMLLEEDYTWEMAGRDPYSTSSTGGYSSGHSSLRDEDC